MKARRPTTRFRPRARREPVIPEKVEQDHVVQLVERVLQGKVYVLGTKRPKGSKCPSCGTFVQEYQGTRQTPGVSDLLCFLPPRPGWPFHGRLVMVEAKSAEGRMSSEQVEYQAWCRRVGIDHVVGTYDAFIAWCLQERYLTQNQVPHYRLPKEAQ